VGLILSLGHWKVTWRYHDLLHGSGSTGGAWK
jgi:hypothetical protein